MESSATIPSSPIPTQRNLSVRPKNAKGGKNKEQVKDPNSTPREIVIIKNLIWLYFFLLIFEGALRKWILPAYANPLLIVRDPVVIAIYLVAIRARAFPMNAFMWTIGVISACCLVVGLTATGNSVGTALFGFRSNFLHLPLIFVMRRVLEPRDIKKMCLWILILGIPMALLMALQFAAPPNSIINSGAMDDFGQITGARGHIRPPGTFSFVTGPIYFFGLLAAVLLHTQFFKRREIPYPLWLIGAGYAALLLAMAVSVSRSLLVNVCMVFGVAFGVTIFLRPSLVPRWLVMMAVMAMAALATSNTSIVQEGLTSMDERVAGAGKAEGGATGFAVRYLSEYTAPFEVAGGVPIFGYGLGTGTLGGQAMLGPEGHAVSPEKDWARIVQESGPLLGGSFILWRICLVLYMTRAVFQALWRKNTLPILLFGVGWTLVLIAMLSQPTIVGFLAFTGGLTLSAAKPVRKPNASRIRYMTAPYPEQLSPAYAPQNTLVS